MTITLEGFAAAANGLASATPSYPASLADNDLVLLHMCSKPSGNPPAFGNTTTGVSMMPQATILGGSGSSGNGSGAMNCTSAARIADGTMPATETVTVTSGSPILAMMSRWSCAAGKQWQMSNSVAVAADTTVTLTDVQANSNAVHLQTGDVVVVTVALTDDVINHTGQAVTVLTGGATISAITWQTKVSTTTGNDAAMYVGHFTVTGGTAGFCTLRYAATSSASGNSGCAVTFQRLREQDPALPGLIGLYGNPTVQPETQGHVIPVRDGNGNWYWFGEGTIAYDTNRPHPSKSTDGGITWKPAVTFANRDQTARDLESAWVIKSGTVMYAFVNRDDTAWCLRLRMSDHATNPDSWDTTEVVDTGMSSSGVIQFIGANLLSTGEMWAFYTGVLSGANNTISYKKRATNGTYGTRQTLVSANNCVGASPVTGAGDLTYVYYKDLTADALVYKTLTAAGVLSAATTVASGTAISSQSVPHTNPIYYDDAGTEVIGIAYTNDAGVLKYREIRGGVLQTEETISSAAVTQNPGSTDSQSAVAHLAVDGTTVHALWSRAADGDLMHDSRVLGTGWGTETVEWASGGSTGWYIYCDVVTIGTDVKLAYIYDQGTHVDDASNNNFNMKQLRTTGGGGTTVTLGLPAETDTAHALTRSKADELGLAVETDTAHALTRSKTVTLGLPVDTSTAAALTSSKTRALGLPTETDTSLTLTRSKTVATGLPAETDTAHPLSHTVTVTLGLPVEADTAPPLTATKTITLGLPVETDTVPAVTAAKTHGLGLPVETDTAHPLTTSSSSGVTLGLASETDTAHPLAAAKTITLGLPVEASTGMPLAWAKSRDLGLPVEASSALQVTFGKSMTVGLAVEVASAFPLTSAKAVTFGLPLETDTAFQIPPLVVLPTPASRTVGVPPEVRVLGVAAEDRTVHVPRDNRTITA